MLSEFGELGAELDLLGLADSEVAQHGKVERISAVGTQNANASVAETVGGRLLVGRGVEPAADAAVTAVQVRIAKNVGTQIAGGECIRRIGLRCNRQGGARL